MALPSFLDTVGLRHLLDRLSEIFVRKVDGKGLSDNNFTTEEKNKLASLENYQMLPATKQTLGGVIIGTGLDVSSNGVVNVTQSEVPWANVVNTPTTVAGFGITNAATTEELQSNVILDMLRAEAIPGTTQRIISNQNGLVTRIDHEGTSGNVRTDAFTYTSGEIREVRTLSTGQSLTISTNTDTLATIISYSEE